MERSAMAVEGEVEEEGAVEVVEMEETTTSSWGLSCGTAPYLQTGGSSSFSTWTWRSFSLKTEWAACTATTAPVPPKSHRRAPSRPCPTRAPSAYRPHLHPGRRPRPPLPRLPHPSSVWRWPSRRALEEGPTVFTVSFVPSYGD